MLIIRDRNSIDGAAYVPTIESFEAMLIDMNISVAHICHSDVSIFLRSLAVDKPDLYRKFVKNNKIRFETVEQAIAADERLLKVYERYAHPYVVNNQFPSFEDKVNRVIEIILDALGEPRLEKELSFVINCDPELVLNRLGISQGSYVDIYQFYMKDGTRYRRITYPGGMHRSYIRTVKIGTDEPDTRIEIENFVTALEFVDAFDRMDTVSKPVDKRRYIKSVHDSEVCFILEVDVFASCLPRDFVRVEVEYGLIRPDIGHLFGGLYCVEITGRENCSNRSIAYGRFPFDLIDLA
jgi:hypothetical protein